MFSIITVNDANKNVNQNVLLGPLCWYLREDSNLGLSVKNGNGNFKAIVEVNNSGLPRRGIGASLTIQQTFMNPCSMLDSLLNPGDTQI